MKQGISFTPSLVKVHIQDYHFLISEYFNVLLSYTSIVFIRLLYKFLFLFLMWTIFKLFIALVPIFLLFNVSVFWL